MDFFSMLTLAHDLGEPKSDNYAKFFTNTTGSTGVAPHFQNHQQQQALGLSSSCSASAGLTERRSDVNGYSENGFEAPPSASSYSSPQGTKRNRDSFGQFETVLSPNTTNSNGLEAISYFTENSCVPAKVCCYLLFGRTSVTINSQYLNTQNTHIVNCVMICDSSHCFVDI